MATDGPMARTVADVRLALSVLNGSDPRDPLSVDVALDQPPLQRRVAGIVTTGLDGPLAPAVETGVRLAADALAQAGWEIEPVELPEFQHVFEVWNRIMCDDIPALLDAVAAVIDPRLVAALEGHIAYPYVTDLVAHGDLSGTAPADAGLALDVRHHPGRRHTGVARAAVPR